MSESDVREYLSHYFVQATVDFLIGKYDLRSPNVFDFAVGDPEIYWMRNNAKITDQEANTLRMIIRTRKINKLLQELNQTY
jgi:hypothetical protein